MGSVRYFCTPHRIPEVIEEALNLLTRAVAVLEETHGEEAVFTLAATYRMAGLQADLRGDTGADILWQKARVLWKGGKALEVLGDKPSAPEAQSMIDEAVQIYWDVSGQSADGDSMQDSSWDIRISHLYR